MRTTRLMLRHKAGWLGLFGLCALAGSMTWGAGKAPAAPAKDKAEDIIALGREIFNREWLPGDSRSHGGDGLGPVYNDTSCVACHNSGGSGGGGPVGKNIDILSASRNRNGMVVFSGAAMLPVGGFAPPVPSAPPQVTQAVAQPNSAKAPAPNTEPLFDLHAGFRNGRTVVLHKFGVDPNYQTWRRQMLQGSPQATVVGVTVTTESVRSTGEVPPLLPIAVTERVLQPIADSTIVPNIAGQGLVSFNPLFSPRQAVVQPGGVNAAQQRMQELRMAMLNAIASTRSQVVAGEFVVSRSQRSPTSLFGLGLIDAIPEKVIEARAAHRSPKFPEVQGRVSRLKDGRIGRLGWKGQTANAEDFVLTACAVEVGLEVPGHEQAVSPQAPKYRASGKDLTAGECAALVAYVRSLPRPLERKARVSEEAKVLGDGKAMFESVGCASCHAPTLGSVDGIYSDLLLHDMGQEMADSGSYNGGGSDDDSDPLNPILEGGQASQANAPPKADRPASRQEWRTPPLWGFRDSAPYLHDGRAQTLEDAVAGHGGEAAASAQRFFELSPKERLQVEAFLKSLVAPPSEDDAAK